MSSAELTPVTFRVFEGTWPRMYPGHIKVEMIAGITDIDGQSVSHDTSVSGPEQHERILRFPRGWVNGLVGAVNALANYEGMNCHGFVRHVLGKNPSGDPIIDSAEELERVETLEAGEVGVMGLTSPTDFGNTGEICHSLLGVYSEERSELSLQVMDAAGELAIAGTDDVLGYYQRNCPEMALFRVD